MSDLSLFGLTEATTTQNSDLLYVGRPGSPNLDRKATIPNVIRGKWDTLRVAGVGARNAATADHVATGTNDQDAIHNALSDLPSAGGTIELWGTFNISSTVVIGRDHVVLKGEGGGQRASGANVGYQARLLAVTGLTGSVLKVELPAATRMLQRVFLRDFLVDGNGIGTDVDGIYYRGIYSDIDGLHIASCTGNGLRTQGISTTHQTIDNRYNNLTISHCGGAGLMFDTNSPDNHITSLISYSNAYGVRMRTSASSHQFTGFHLYNNSINGMFVEATGARTKCVNGKIEQSGEHGMLIDGTGGNGPTDFQISAMNFKNNGQTTEGVHYHLSLQGSPVISRFNASNINFSFVSTVGTGLKALRYINIAHNNTADSEFWGISHQANGVTDTTTPLINLTPGTRTLVNGWGINAGNPASAGQWNGNGREGVAVVDSGSSASYVYRNGAWRAL